MIIENKSWHVIHESVIGKSHSKLDMPNQDAVASEILSEEVIITALADGHGSKKCFRSDRGAHYAVDACLTVAKDLYQEWLKEDGSLNTKKIGRHFTKRIVKLWQSNVADDTKANPFEDEVLESLSDDERKSIQKNPSVVYGSTLIMVLIIGPYVVCYQLGDGDILFVSRSKKVSRPLKKDKRHIANDTLSLCLHKPEKEFKIRVFRDLNHLLQMVVLSTDGYANSFSDDQAFQKVGADLVNLVEEEGLACIDDNLESWLEETTQLGSGDDISVSVLTRRQDQDFEA